MALYEYKCKDCGKTAEMLVFSSDDTLECPSCGSHNLEKLMSTFAVSMGPSKSSAPAPSCSTGCCGGSCGIG